MTRTECIICGHELVDERCPLCHTVKIEAVIRSKPIDSMFPDAVPLREIGGPSVHRSASGAIDIPAFVRGEENMR